MIHLYKNKNKFEIKTFLRSYNVGKNNEFPIMQMNMIKSIPIWTSVIDSP